MKLYKEDVELWLLDDWAISDVPILHKNFIQLCNAYLELEAETAKLRKSVEMHIEKAEHP